MGILEILRQHAGEFLVGLRVTVKLALAVWGIGLVLGLVLGVAGTRWRRAVGIPSRIASFVLGGIPILVFLFWLHYPVQTLLGVVIDPFYTATAALGIVNTLLVSDIVRGALVDFPTQYIWAAQACGLNSRQIVQRIQLPLILRSVLPSLLFAEVAMLQATLFASLISVDELFRIAQRVNSEVYRPVEIYTALALFFLAVCLPLNGLALWMRARYTRDFSER